MGNDIRNQINDLQLSILQDYLELQMRNVYGSDWLKEVEQLVKTKIEMNDSRASTYKHLYDRIRMDGIETISVKDMDITLVSALLMFDYFNVCEVGSSFRGQVGKIRNDKNLYISHNSDLGDVLSNNIMELSSLKNLKQFVIYLKNASWNCNEKDRYLERYEKRVEETIQLFYQSMKDKDFEEIDLNSDINLSLEKIIQEQNEHKMAYVALSYKRVDDSLTRYTLDQLQTENGRGFVVFADAGYGKSWSIQELAGRYATEYLLSPTTCYLPVLIKMGQIVSDSSTPIMEQIKEILYPYDASDEKLKLFIKKKRIALFVDGMDEAPGDIKKSAEKELRNFYENYSNIIIVGGTRESDRYRFPSDLPQYNICDLSDIQVEEFIDKLVIEEYREMAKEDVLNNNTGFLRNMRTPFYMTCYAEFINYGETAPISSTDLVTRCLDKMIDREIRIKGFSASLNIINTFLCEFCTLLGDRNYMLDNEAIGLLKEKFPFESSVDSDVMRIKNKLVEIQILRIVENKKHYFLGFAHEQYRTIYAPLSNDNLFDFEEGYNL